MKTKKIHSNLFFLLVLVVTVGVLLLSFIASAFISATTTDVNIGDIRVVPDEIVTSPIMISDVSEQGVSGAMIKLTYDPGVVNVIAVENSSFDSLVANIQNPSGYTKIIAFQTGATGLSGDVKFADIEFKAVGEECDISFLNLVDIELCDDNTGAQIPYSVNNGLFTITCDAKDGCYPYGTGCEERDYYCSEGLCTYSYSNRHTDYHGDWVNYCKGDEAWKRRLFHDFYCEGGSCTNHTSWQNDTFIENCSVSDGWYDTGNTSWIDDPDNECKEKEQKKQEYRDYYCSAGSCNYTVTDTKWEDTGEVRNKPDGTVCGCTANNTLKKCYAGICSDTGICNSTLCDADSACDGKKPGDTCDADKNCNSTCKCVTPPDTNPPVVIDVSVSPQTIPEDTDGDPRWGEVATMNVTLNDESNITSVTIDLSAIGKPANKPMIKNPGADVWSVTTNASIGTAGWNGTAYVHYQMRVNATDEHGNSNANISLNLTVMKNGDISGDGDVDVWDCTYLARHIVGIEGYEKMSDEVADVSGDGDVDVWDCAYLAKYLVEIPGYELLR